MNVHQSAYPALEAGIHITKFLEEKAGECVLLLLSGGSALAVLEHIPERICNPNLYIGLVDDRFTQDRKGNTFSVLTETLFYKQSLEHKVHWINSQAQEGESFAQFCKKVQDQITTIKNERGKVHTLGLFGIGEDGHTASLFPNDQNTFATLLTVTDFYVEVYESSNAYPQRISLTPHAIASLDEVIVFASGKNKCEDIIPKLLSNTLKPYQAPAVLLTQHPQSTLYTDCSTLTQDN